jgi:hypothetical protein
MGQITQAPFSLQLFFISFRRLQQQVSHWHAFDCAALPGIEREMVILTGVAVMGTPRPVPVLGLCWAVRYYAELQKASRHSM